MPVVQAGHQHASRRRANGCTRVKMSQAQAFTGHSIKVGSRDYLLAIAAKITITQIVSHDPNQIGFALKVVG